MSVRTGSFAGLYIIDGNESVRRVRIVDPTTNAVTTRSVPTAGVWTALTVTTDTLFYCTAGGVFKAPLAGGAQVLVAGQVAGGENPADGTGATARFKAIVGIGEHAGTLYVLDRDGNGNEVGRIRIVVVSTGVVTTISTTDIAKAAHMTTLAPGVFAFASDRQIHRLDVTSTPTFSILAGQTGDGNIGSNFAEGVGTAANFGEITGLAPMPASQSPHGTVGVVVMDGGGLGNSRVRLIPTGTPTGAAQLSVTLWLAAGPGHVDGPVATAEFATGNAVAARFLAGAPAGLFVTTNNEILRTLVLPPCGSPGSTPPPRCEHGHRRPESTGVCTPCGEHKHRAEPDTSNTCTPCEAGTLTDPGVVAAENATFCKNATRPVVRPGDQTEADFRNSGPGHGVRANTLTANTTQVVMTVQTNDGAPQSSSGAARTLVAWADLTPSGLSFPDGVLVCFQIPDGTDPTSVTIHFFDVVLDAWVALPTTQRAPGVQSVCATFFHFTAGAVLGNLPAGASASDEPQTNQAAIIIAPLAMVALVVLIVLLSGNNNFFGLGANLQNQLVTSSAHGNLCAAETTDAAWLLAPA
jgi:hypothetical protein